MIIAVGSKNIVKIQAVEEVIKDYSFFNRATIASLGISSEIADQPLSLEEIIQGAKNRARNAFAATASCFYSFGLESGLFKAPGTSTGFLEACACAIYDGKNYSLGLSSAFEVPSHILNYIFEKKMDLSQACYHSGITTNANFASSEGLIGSLLKGKVSRKEYTKQSIIMSLIQLENPELYHQD